MVVILTAFLTLLAGVLTVLTPCALPLLPVIVGGGLAGGTRRPWIVAAGLVVTLITFTVLLKASTSLMAVDARVWLMISGLLILFLGLSMLFPGGWAVIAQRLGFSRGANTLLACANRTRGSWSAAATGVALGPVFSSCSPTYAWVIATVLPTDMLWGMTLLGLYCLGLVGALVLLSLLGRRIIERFSWAMNPQGWFRRGVALLLVVVGVLVTSGTHRNLQVWAAGLLPAVGQIEAGSVAQEVPGPQESAPPDGTEVHEAPELTGIEAWINSDPVSLAELRGRVLLIDFWTYSCINCIRTQPYLNAWYERYRDQGLEIIGVHAPEFAFERLPENVERAVKEAGIEYPVALDNEFATWRAYGNRYWPAKYLIDRNGNLVFSHHGEGAYEETEQRIRELLQEKGPVASVTPEGKATTGQSPEIHLGAERTFGYKGTPDLDPQLFDYTPAGELASSQWHLDGQWQVGGESITAVGDGAGLRIRFDGREMFLVAGGPPGSTVEVRVNGELASSGRDVRDGVASLESNGLHRLVELPEFATGTLVELRFSAGVTAHALTFGG